jgi:hypothetical protein
LLYFSLLDYANVLVGNPALDFAPDDHDEEFVVLRLILDDASSFDVLHLAAAVHPVNELRRKVLEDGVEGEEGEDIESATFV